MGPPNHDYSPGRGRSPDRHGERKDNVYTRSREAASGGQFRDSAYSKREERSPSRSRSRTPDRRRRRSPPRSPPLRPRNYSSSRSRSRSASPAYRRRRSYSRSHSRSRSPSTERHKHKGKKHRRKRSRSRSVSSSDAGTDGRHHTKKKRRSREEKDRRKKEKKEKKYAFQKKKHATGSSSSRWGKYGVITDADFYEKTQEFRTWLLEERKLNPESLSKDQERKEFQVYMEDYNTGMLIYCYYHIEAYERRMSALRSGEFVPPADDAYDPAADMKAHSSKHKKLAAEQDSYLNREQLMELRKVQNERIEVQNSMKRLGMDIKQNMGVRMDGSMFDG
ncbi:hypothetical protein ID866_9708 [Astraeus odoratus]|nr:hypothetical protein ID866_9708 [Astraeus odoratus]